jgi:hypothetical protein
MVERERALADDSGKNGGDNGARAEAGFERRRRRWRALRAFVFGLIIGVAALFALALLSPQPPQ